MICIEFIKMLCKHMLDTLVEVLMFAIARQMIVEHTTPLENLIGISAIAVLLYLENSCSSSLDDVDRTIFLPSQKISDINQLIHVGIPEEFRGETLGDLMKEYVEKGERGFQVGQCYFFLGGALRVERVVNGQIVEIRSSGEFDPFRLCERTLGPKQLGLSLFHRKLGSYEIKNSGQGKSLKLKIFDYNYYRKDKI